MTKTIYPHQLTHGRCKKKLTLKEARSLKYTPGKVIFENKEDGHRFWLQIRPNGSTQNFLVSRHVSKQTGVLVEKQEKLPKVRDYKFDALWNDCVLDGEWVSERSNTVSTDVSHDIASGKGKYVCWDIVVLCGKNIEAFAWASRQEILAKLLVRTKTIPSWFSCSQVFPNIKAALAFVEANHTEGLVAKDIDAPYGNGWTKIKAVDHFDCIIWGVEGSKTSEEWKKKGIIGAIKIGQWRLTTPQKARLIDNTWCPCPKHFKDYGGGHIGCYAGLCYSFEDMGTISGITLDLRKKISKQPDMYLGKIVEIKAQQRLPSGLFRSPRFNRLRDDKNHWECLIEP